MKITHFIFIQVDTFIYLTCLRKRNKN